MAFPLIARPFPMDQGLFCDHERPFHRIAKSARVDENAFHIHAKPFHMDEKPFDVGEKWFRVREKPLRDHGKFSARTGKRFTFAHRVSSWMGNDSAFTRSLSA